MNRDAITAETDASGDESETCVLLVDRRVQTGEETKRELEALDRDFAVTVAFDTTAALAHVAQEPVDCVVSDCYGLDADGASFLHELNRRYPDLPVVLFADALDADAVHDAYAQGISQYLRRGAYPEQYVVLAHTIERAVGYGELRRSPELGEVLETSISQHEATTMLAGRALSETDVDALLDCAVETVASELGVRYCKVLELTPDGERLLLRSGVGWKEGVVGSATVEVNRNSQAGYTLLRREPVVVNDLRTETRFYGPPLLVDHGIVSGISVVIGDLDEPWGVLGTHHTEARTFSRNDIGFVATVAYIIELALQRVAYERELEQQNESLERLTGLLAHDLRNPLSVAAGYLDLAQETTTGGEEYFDRVKLAHERISALIADTLAVSRDADVGMRDVCGSTSLTALSQRAWASVETADARLVVDADVSVPGDVNRNQRLLENLFRNAVVHGGHDVTVRVGSLAVGAGIFVEDDGVGIPLDKREAVFDLGYSTDPEGTGFGLHIVDEIARGNQWTVSVGESAAGGARFELSFPAD